MQSALAIEEILISHKLVFHNAMVSKTRLNTIQSKYARNSKAILQTPKETQRSPKESIGNKRSPKEPKVILKNPEEPKGFLRNQKEL